LHPTLDRRTLAFRLAAGVRERHSYNGLLVRCTSSAYEQKPIQPRLSRRRKVAEKRAGSILLPIVCSFLPILRPSGSARDTSDRRTRPRRCPSTPDSFPDKLPTQYSQFFTVQNAMHVLVFPECRTWPLESWIRRSRCLCAVCFAARVGFCAASF
jgi:hypothetical protein